MVLNKQFPHGASRSALILFFFLRYDHDVDSILWYLLATTTESDQIVISTATCSEVPSSKLQAKRSSLTRPRQNLEAQHILSSQPSSSSFPSQQHGSARQRQQQQLQLQLQLRQHKHTTTTNHNHDGDPVCPDAHLIHHIVPRPLRSTPCTSCSSLRLQSCRCCTAAHILRGRNILI